MMPQKIDTWAIRMDLAAGYPAQHIVDWTGERLEMLVHLLAVNGCPDLSVALLKAAMGVRT